MNMGATFQNESLKRIRTVETATWGEINTHSRAEPMRKKNMRKTSEFLGTESRC